MDGNGGPGRGQIYAKTIVFVGVVLLGLAGSAGQLVAVLPVGDFNGVELATAAASLAGVIFVVGATDTLAARSREASARALESGRTADALRDAATSLVGLHRVGEIEAVATRLAASLASSPGSERQVTFYEISSGTAVATADDGQIGHLMGLAWEVGDNPLVETALRDGRAVAAALDEFTFSPELEAVFDEIGVTHAAALPVSVGGQPFGALTIVSCGTELAPELLDPLTDLLHIVELSLTNAVATERVEELVQSEATTGLLNRSGLEKVVERTRGRLPFVVLAFELEGLTTLHDQGGLAAGDELITRFADVARSQVRRNDALAFVGGAEFLAVLFDAGQVEAEALAFRVVNAASEHSVGGLPIRASISIATGEASDLFDDVVRRADTGLEIAKQDGGGTDYAEAEAEAEV